MRLWIPALLLLSCFAAATLWQSRWTRELRDRRDRPWETAERRAWLENGSAHELSAPGARSMTLEPAQPQWARVVVGRPSGARPVDRRPCRPAAVLAVDPQADAAWESLEPDFTMTVRSGHSLSMICEQHYGNARAELVLSLAHYNSLADPDRIRAGQTLHLPAIAKLQPVSRP